MSVEEHLSVTFSIWPDPGEQLRRLVLLGLRHLHGYMELLEAEPWPNNGRRPEEFFLSVKSPENLRKPATTVSERTSVVQAESCRSSSRD